VKAYWRDFVWGIVPLIAVLAALALLYNVTGP